MKLSQVVMVTVGLLVAAASSWAQTLSYGATLTSDCLARGITQTNPGVALQPWIEDESSGWYAGVWASNVSLGVDSVEFDLSGGYRFDASGTSFDTGYVRYINNSTGDAGARAIS